MLHYRYQRRIQLSQQELCLRVTPLLLRILQHQLHQHVPNPNFIFFTEYLPSRLKNIRNIQYLH